MPTTSNFGWTTPADTDLVKDGAAAIRTLGNGVDASLVDLKGGTTGQILSKASNTDLDYTWIANDQGDITQVSAGTGITVTNGTGPVPTVAIDSTVATLTGTQTLTNKTIALGSNTVSGTTAQFNTALTDGDFATIAGTETLTNKTLTSPVLTTPTISTIDAKGDLLAGTADNTIGRLAVGANNTVLTADSSTATGLKWAAPAAASYVGVSVYKSANQSIANNTDTALTFDSEFFDTDSFHSTVTNTSRLTIPSGKGGKYLLSGAVSWGAAGGTIRVIKIYKNGSILNQVSQFAGTNDGAINPVSNVYELVATDYLEVYGRQNSGGNLDVQGGTQQTTIQLTYLGA